MRTPQKRWTPAEKASAVEMHEQGLTAAQIADKLGRSLKSVQSILYNPRRSEPRASSGYLTPFYDGPPIARCPTQERLTSNARIGSQCLLAAIQMAGVHP